MTQGGAPTDPWRLPISNVPPPVPSPPTMGPPEPRMILTV